MAKLTPIHRSTITAAAARSALAATIEDQADSGNRAAGAALCAHAEDTSGAEAARAEAESRHDPEIARLGRIIADEPDERLRRHVIRDLAASPHLRRAAERYLSEQAIPGRVGYIDGRDGGTVSIHSLGPDWRTGPAVRLSA